MTNAMSEHIPQRRQLLFVWALCCVLAASVFFSYASASLTAGHGEYVMPLDDVYIHFQYAHQLAAGQPYVYNDGLPASSGATSFLYPYVLALGDLLGFKALNLGVWAMGIGALALALSGWLLFRVVLLLDAPLVLAALAVPLFMLTGAVSWHFMSGMETGLTILFVLWVLYGFIGRHYRVFLAGAVLLTLTRPEGGALSILAAVLWAWRAWRESYPRDAMGRIRYSAVRSQARLAWLVLPVLAMGVQPFVNWLITQSAVASGNSSKSIFGVVPFYLDEVIARWFSNVGQIALEWVTGMSAREGMYVPVVITLLALIGLGRLFWRRDFRLVALLLLGWLVIGAGAASTLDTVFWHFKRYQMWMMVLAFPLATVAAVWLLRLERGHSSREHVRINALSVDFNPKHPRIILGGAVFIVTVLLTVNTAQAFWRHYVLNVHYVFTQPLQMARWLSVNTPPDAVIAVHDTGMMRYIGGRTTVDMVGLTTAGAASYWRNGPGAVAEFLDLSRPDYIASYGHGHGYGLGFLADTPLFAETLLEVPVALDPQFNVALAADVQGIYRPDWTAFDTGNSGALQASILPYVTGSPLAVVDVADIAIETAADYEWHNAERRGGFPTDVYAWDYMACDAADCRVVDGGRYINGEERFFVDVPVDGDLMLVTRVHPVHAGAVEIYANGVLVGTRAIPALAGSWLEFATRLPHDILTPRTEIKIVPQMPDGYYLPYHHWVYRAGDAHLAGALSDAPLTTYQDGAIVLDRAEFAVQDGQLVLDLTWWTDGTASGDAKLFIHILNADGDTVAQADVRAGANTLPPANWLDGFLHDSIMVDLVTLDAGQYQVMLGLYDPVTFERWTPSDGDDAARVPLGAFDYDG